MQITKAKQQNFGLRLSQSMRTELTSVYKGLQHHNQPGLQPEFLDNVVENFATKCTDSFLDFKLVVKGLFGLRKEKQCFLSTPKAETMIWNKKSGLFSKNKTHLTADDIAEISEKINSLDLSV